MIRRWLILSSLCLLMGRPAAAQMAPYCGQLSEADCTLMLDGQRSLAEIHSVTINRASMRSLDGFGGSKTFSVRGVVSSLPVDMIRVFDGLNADLTLVLDVYDAPETAPTQEDLPEHSQVHVRIVNDVLYVEMDSFVPPLEDSTLSGWASFALNDLVPPPPPTDPPPQSTPIDRDLEPVVLGDNVETLVISFEPHVLNQFLSVTRSGDRFETKVDFAAMYANPVFQDTLRERLQNLWRRYSPPWEETISDDKLARLASEMDAIFPQPVMLYSITIDSETRQARGFEMWGMMDFLIIVEAGINGGTLVGDWAQLGMNVSVDFTDVNAVEMVTAPTDARPMSIDALTGIHIMAYLFPQLQAESVKPG